MFNVDGRPQGFMQETAYKNSDNVYVGKLQFIVRIIIVIITINPANKAIIIGTRT